MKETKGTHYSAPDLDVVELRIESSILSVTDSTEGTREGYTYDDYYNMDED